MAETLEERLTRIYAEAAEDLRKKLAKYLARYAAKDAQKRRQRDAGEITEEEYRDWVAGQVFRGNLWRQKVDQATGTLADANAAALQIINGERLGVFAESANFQAYQLTKDANAAINFSIYDEDAVGRLLKDEPELLPRKKLDRAKDRGWNQKQIAGAVAQGIIQGESIPNLAKRIARDTASKNSGAMIRYARTAITGAQNAGRVETLRRGKALGIRCKKSWLATLDGSTRDSHREMDGKTVDVDEDFHTPLGSKMQYPGDMAGKPADIWNCRCTVTYEYEDYPQENAERIAYEEGVDENGKPYRRSKLIKDMTYREWKRWKKSGGKSATTTTPGRTTIMAAPMGTADALDYYVAHGEKQLKELTKEEKRAVSDYGYNNLSAETNGYLRGDEDKWEPWQEEDIKANIEALDRAIGKMETEDDLVLYRGVGNDYLGLDFSNPEKLIGQTVTEGGYMSTSGSLDAAEIYGRGVVLELQVPKGTNAAYVDLVQSSGKELLQNYKDDGDAGNIEYLLARGGQIKFTGYSMEKDASGKEYLKMKAEFVPKTHRKPEPDAKVISVSANSLKEKIGKLAHYENPKEIYFKEEYYKKNVLPVVDEATNKKVTDAYNNRDWSEFKKATVDVSKLLTNQGFVDARTLEGMADAYAGENISGTTKKDAIRVVKYNGQYVLMDGNHRVNIAALKGQEKINVLVMDLDGDMNFPSAGEKKKQFAPKAQRKPEPDAAPAKEVQPGPPSKGKTMTQKKLLDKINAMKQFGKYDDEKTNLLPMAEKSIREEAHKRIMDIPDKDRATCKGAKATYLKISDLQTEQEQVFTPNLEDLAEKLAGSYISGVPTEEHDGIMVAKYKGQYIVMDGNNRTNLALLKGQDTIRVMVYDFDQEQPGGSGTRRKRK